uniref:NADH dehydrogenase subunit 4 n=1 Tax=Chorisoserrata biceps TaxID=3037039 RepID=UPI0027A928F9|nr:NADH dehydrogenase subunit 4 [Chorisoserrata biceps]WGO57192.1 NADH dehydrogenase subunit 4 [Chorisoserrata biceps]
MLSFIFYIGFLILLCLFNNIWWLVQSLIFFLMFLFLFNFSGNYYFGSVSYIFGCDYVSYGLILLSIWICVLMLLASSSLYNLNFFFNIFVFIILFLLLMLVCAFSSMGLFSFYLFFESSLIPTLFLIIGWGYQPERLQAGIYLLFYTLLGSLPLLMMIIYLYNFYGGVSYCLMINFYHLNWLMYLCMVMAFLVSMPMYLVHLWLPKAHVEAPVSGSMILAGILLKLGGYGLIRFMSMMVNIGVKYNYIWISLGLMGGLLTSLICLRQTDLKSLIAYSSIAHMGLVIGGLMTLSSWGFGGSYVLMIGHGLCSSGLFCLANICYERVGSRSLLMNKGLLNFMPSMSMWWFMFSSCNMAAPPSLNLLGEVGLINSLVGWSFLTMFILIFLSFFSAVYTLYLYSYSQHGMLFSGLFCCSSGYVREYILLFLHWIPLNLLILVSDYMMFWF